jgi:hypothetical protein
MLDLRPSKGTANGSIWRVNVLDLLQPEDELDDLLSVGDYGAAAALANKHSLPQDLVLK